MEPGLRIQFQWFDQDVDEIAISASNGDFSGRTRAYIETDSLFASASALTGFPKHASDVRELQFGDSAENSAGGWARLRFSCRDAAAHSIVEIQIKSKNELRPSAQWNTEPQAAHFFAEIEAAAVDDFVRELQQVSQRKNGIAQFRFKS